MKIKRTVISESGRDQLSRPALTPQDRENQMISLAMDLVEKRLREGTASSQETTHFLKLATVREQLEREKLVEEKKLLEAKIANLESTQHTEEIYEEALKAMRSYSGQENLPIDEDEHNEY